MYAFIWMLCAVAKANRLLAAAIRPKDGNSIFKLVVEPFRGGREEKVDFLEPVKGLGDASWSPQEPGEIIGPMHYRLHLILKGKRD